MKKLTQSMVVTALAIVLLSGCWNKEEETPGDQGTPEAASIGEIVNKPGQGPESPNCPDISEPVCTTSKMTYRNACDAETAGEQGWSKGAC